MSKRFFSYSLCLILAFFSINHANKSQAMPGATSQASGVEGEVVSGTVTETMDASGYTYMKVKSGATESWVAIPETVIKKGSTVNYFNGMIMENFTSKTLQQTFDTIVFSPGLAEKAATPRSDEKVSAGDSFAAAVKAERPGSGQSQPQVQPAAGSAGSAGAIVPLAELNIEKAAGTNSYNVGEIFTKATDLNGQKIQVRGKVVKFSPQIMGRNWIHLQDGTGDPMQNSHDLVVTTNEEVAVDSIVTMEGVLAADKDFGAGYKYVVIIEQAGTVK